MNKMLPVALIGLLVVGCTTTEYVDRLVYVERPAISIPVKPKAPLNPGLKDKVVVITEDNIKPNTAYVGFEYNDWLEFAKYQHGLKAFMDQQDAAFETLKKAVTVAKEEE